jgi:hypothetical protein
LTMHLIYSYINKPTRCTIFSTLLCYHASTCFRLIFSPSSGGRVYNVVNGTWFSSELTIGRLVFSSKAANNQFRRKTSTICHIIHSTSWWWAKNEPETCTGVVNAIQWKK